MWCPAASWGGDPTFQSNVPAGQFTAISTGYFHSCGLRTDGDIACWGYQGSLLDGAPDGVTWKQ